MKYTDIKLVVVDIDGTLTNGMYTVSSDGVITKSFFTRDFYALEMLMNNKISVLILTNSGDSCITHRIKEIMSNSEKWKKFYNNRYLYIITNISDKKEYVKSSCYNLRINSHNVAYIGDAHNDVEAMKICLYTGCPSDAIDKVKEESNYISDKSGGNGAVYDFVIHILNKRSEEINESTRTE